MVCYYIYHGIRAQPASLCPAPIFLFSNEPLRALSIHTPIYISHFLEDHHHHRLQIKERLKSLSRSTRVRINALTVSLSAPFVALSSASLALARPIINSSSQSVSRAVCPTVQLSDSLSVCHTCNSLSLLRSVLPWLMALAEAWAAAHARQDQRPFNAFSCSRSSRNRPKASSS